MNIKGADQPAHPRRLISAFVIRLLESIISRLAMSKISIFQLVSVAEQAGLNNTFSETLKTGCRGEAHIRVSIHGSGETAYFLRLV